MTASLGVTQSLLANRRATHPFRFKVWQTEDEQTDEIDQELDRRSHLDQIRSLFSCEVMELGTYLLQESVTDNGEWSVCDQKRHTDGNKRRERFAFDGANCLIRSHTARTSVEERETGTDDGNEFQLIRHHGTVVLNLPVNQE